MHAGADPARAMEDQTARVLLWGHPEFDSAPRSDDAWVAHGHVELDSPVFAEGADRRRYGRMVHRAIDGRRHQAGRHPRVPADLTAAPAARPPLGGLQRPPFQRLRFSFAPSSTRVFHSDAPVLKAARPIMCAATGAVSIRNRIARIAREIVALSAKKIATATRMRPDPSVPALVEGVHPDQHIGKAQHPQTGCETEKAAGQHGRPP